MTSHSYFVVMVEYPWRINGAGVPEAAGCQAVVDPEITKREVLSRIRSGEYPIDRIRFIHEVYDGHVCDVTDGMKAISGKLEHA
jgi:hypothetical protein